MMFQSYALFPHMSVGDNIAFGLKQEHLPKARDPPSASSRCWSSCRCASCAAQAASALRRAAAARGTGAQPGQAAEAAAARRAAGRARQEDPPADADRAGQVIRQVGVTCVMVTHDQEEAMTMADRIGVMSRGALAAGRPAGRDLRSPEQPLHRRLHRRHQHFLRHGEGRRAGAQRRRGAGHGARHRRTRGVVRAAGQRRVGIGPSGEHRAAAGTARGRCRQSPAWVPCAMSRIWVARRCFMSSCRRGRIVKAAVPTAYWRQDPPPAQGETIVVRWPPAACVVLTS